MSGVSWAWRQPPRHHSIRCAVIHLVWCVGKQGLVAEKKVFEVHIEQGHKHNSKVTLRGEAGCSEPNVLPGDVVFILEQKQHPTFKRIAHDLICEKVGFSPRTLVVVFCLHECLLSAGWYLEDSSEGLCVYVCVSV